MIKFRYVKRNGIWYRRDPEGVLMDKPMPKGFVPPKRHHIAAKISLISVLTALGGLGLAKSGRSPKNTRPDSTPTPILQTVDGRALLPAGFVSSDFDTTQNTQTTASATVNLPPDLLQPNSTVLSDAEATLASSVSNNLFRSIQSVAPTNTPTNTLWQYTSTLQKLSTDTNGVCKAVDMPQQNFTNFVSCIQSIPTNELDKVIQDVATNAPLYSFQSLSKALINNTSNTAAVAQESFLLSRRYQVHNLFATEVPTYEGDENFIYWDAAGIPTVGKGINLVANPDILTWLRIQNSAKLRQLLPNLSDSRYVTLTAAQLNTLTQNVRKNQLVGKSSRTFGTKYALFVHTDDLSKLDQYFHQKVAKTLKKVERDLERDKPRRLANESVLFGSYISTNQVPLRAVETVLDIAYNTGNNIRSLWKNLTEAIENRDFLRAKGECTVQGVQESRNDWHKNNMQAAHDQWQTNHPPRQTSRDPNTASR